MFGFQFVQLKSMFEGPNLVCPHVWVSTKLSLLPPFVSNLTLPQATHGMLLILPFPLEPLTSNFASIFV